MSKKRNQSFCDVVRTEFKGYTCKRDKRYPLRYVVSEKGTECLNLEMNDDHAFVLNLYKCPHSAGSATMKTLETTCRKLGLPAVKLQDGSALQIQCGKKLLQIPMDMLTILADGQSWYNSIGYKSPTHASEVAHNRVIGRMNAQEFVERTLRLRKKKCPYKKMDYWGSLDRTVNDYFTDIKANLKLVSPTKDSTAAECVKYRWLEYFLQAVKHIRFGNSKSPIKVMYDSLNLSLPLTTKTRKATK